MRRIDQDQPQGHWKIAISGKPGTGKTNLGVSAPDPLILLSEQQGLVHVRHAALRMGKSMPPVLSMERISDYKAVLRALTSPDPDFVVHDWNTGDELMRIPNWRPKTVVHDSLSDTCDMMFNEIKEQSPPETGRDGLPKLSQRVWGVQIDRMTSFVKLFRDLPYNVLFLCLRDEQTKTDSDGNITERVVQPKLSPRSLVPVLSAAVNLLGYSYRTSDRKTKAPVYGVLFEAGDEAVCKPCAPLRATEPPDVSHWIDRLNGLLSGQQVPAQPDGPMEVAMPTQDEAGATPKAPQAPEPEAEQQPQPKRESMDAKLGGDEVNSKRRTRRGEA